jgi:Flp pilus assembly protein TadD
VAVYRQGRLDEAEALCHKTLKADPRHVPALHLLGVINLRKHNPAGAVEAFDRLLKLQPNSPDVLNNQAMALYDVGRRDEALASLDKALALRPTRPARSSSRAIRPSSKPCARSSSASARARRCSTASAIAAMSSRLISR